MEKMIERILDKAKTENDIDYVISKAKVYEDLRVSGELTEEVKTNFKAAEDFISKLVFFPKTAKVLFSERFKNKNYEDYIKLFEEEEKEMRERK